MTVKEFLTGKTLTSANVAGDVIMNLLASGETCRLDTSSIKYGTKVETFTKFTLKNDILTINGITLDTSVVNILEDKNKNEK